MKKLQVFALIICLIPFGLIAEETKQPGESGQAAVQIPLADESQNDAASQSLRLTLNVDFTTVSMKQANDAMNDDYAVTKLGAGVIGTFDIEIAVYPFLMLGPRAGYLYCFPATSEHVLPGPLNTKTSMDVSLIPVEAGATLRFGLPGTAISLSAGAFGGVGFAHVVNNVDVINAGSQTSSYVQPYDGLGFCGEINAAVEIKIAKNVDFNVNAGYRLANIINVKQSENVDYSLNSVIYTVGNKGETMKDASNTDVPFDFSGINIGIGISLGF
jgi:hypothetical protein